MYYLHKWLINYIIQETWHLWCFHTYTYTISNGTELPICTAASRFPHSCGNLSQIWSPIWIILQQVQKNDLRQFIQGLGVIPYNTETLANAIKTYTAMHSSNNRWPTGKNTNANINKNIKNPRVLFQAWNRRILPVWDLGSSSLATIWAVGNHEQKQARQQNKEGGPQDAIISIIDLLNLLFS